MAYDAENFVITPVYPPGVQERLDMLRGVREQLLKRGWCQHSTINGRGNVCLVGALNFWDGTFTAGPIVTMPRINHRDSYNRNRDLLADELRYSAPYFNDRVAKNFDDVLSALDARIEYYESGGRLR